MGVSEIPHSQEVSSGLGVSSETLHPEDRGSRLAWGLRSTPTPRNASGPGKGLLMKVSEIVHPQEGKLGLRAGSRDTPRPGRSLSLEVSLKLLLPGERMFSKT